MLIVWTTIFAIEPIGAYRRPAVGPGAHDYEVRESKQAIEAAAGI
jgi:hypothetical protein